MKLWPTFLVCPVYIASLAGIAPAAGSTATRARLRTLAARAVNKSGWKPLRSFAESVRDPEEQGGAYLVLGYREYQARGFTPAAADLARAAATGFSLVDLAEYYAAQAALNAGDAAHAATALMNFSVRFPSSAVRTRALEVLARAWLEAHQPRRAIEALKADPATARRSALALLLAQAYDDAGEFPEAAKAFQDVYFGFPTSAESAAAGERLAQLRSALGATFPAPTEPAETARAEILLHRGRAAEALKAYEDLLATRPASAQAWDWKLGRAQCLIELKRFHDAVESLAEPGPSEPQLAGERLAILVNAYADLDDSDAMLQSLDQFAKLDLPTSTYAAALAHVGYFFFRHGDWAQAARFDRTLAELPRAPEGRTGAAEDALQQEAAWRAAWAQYLQGQNEAAQSAMIAYLRRYPESSRAPAALYWLGRISETTGALREAKALYALEADRFPHSYYAGESRRRLGLIGYPAGRSSVPNASRRSTPTPGTSAPIARELAAVIPLHPAPTAELCASGETSPALHAFETLEALSLDGLAGSYLRDEIARQPDSPELLLALARFESTRSNYSDTLFTAHQLVPGYANYQFSQLPKEIWQQLYPAPYWNLVRSAARDNRLDPYIVMGLIRQESAFDARATSVANARGLMQIRPGTAETFVRSRRRRRRPESSGRLATQLYGPAYNVRLGCRYLSRLVKSFNGSTEQALAAYNAGDDRAREWLARGPFAEPAAFVESIPFADTRAYVESVLRDAVVYRAMLGGAPRFRRCPR